MLFVCLFVCYVVVVYLGENRKKGRVTSGGVRVEIRGREGRGGEVSGEMTASVSRGVLLSIARRSRDRDRLDHAELAEYAVREEEHERGQIDDGGHVADQIGHHDRGAQLVDELEIGGEKERRGGGQRDETVGHHETAERARRPLDGHFEIDVGREPMRHAAHDRVLRDDNQAEHVEQEREQVDVPVEPG